jgi:hypothetical protein
MRQMEEMIQGLRQQVDTLEKAAGSEPVLSPGDAASRQSPAPCLPEMRVPALPPLPPPPANAGLGKPRRRPYRRHAPATGHRLLRGQ